MTKFLVILVFFLMKSQNFIFNIETLYATVCYRDLKYVNIKNFLILCFYIYI